MSKAYICSLFTLFATIGLLISGCDNPENQASRELRRSTEQTHRAGPKADPGKLRASLETAIRKGPRSGLTKDASVLTSGNLAFSEAQNLGKQLRPVKISINENLAKADKLVSKINTLMTERDKYEGLLASGDREAEQLREILTGTAEKPGLYDRLEKEQKELEKLYQQKQQFESKIDNIQSKISSVRLDIDEYTDELESAQTYPQELIDLKMREKDHLRDLQSEKDQLEIVQSDINITEPIIEKIKNDIASLKKRIDDIKNAPQRRQLREQISALLSEAEGLKGDLNKTVTQIDSLWKQYGEISSEAAKTYESAADDYKSVRDRQANSEASLRLGDCYYRLGLNFENQARTARYISQRLEAVNKALGAAPADIASRAQKYAGEAAGLIDAANENYSLAIETYDRVSGGGEFGCSVIKSALLAVHHRIGLADFTGEMPSEELTAKLDELSEKAQNCDKEFMTSLTARILTGNLEYTPKLEVDSATYYTEMKPEFQGYKNLTGDQRKAEIERLLARLDELEPQAPDKLEEFNRILGPERQQLQAELTRLEQPEAAPAGPGSPFAQPGRGADPNRF